MIAEIGHFSLMLALVLCLIQGVLPMAGTFLGVRSWVELARPASAAVALCLTISFGTPIRFGNCRGVMMGFR